MKVKVVSRIVPLILHLFSRQEMPGSESSSSTLCNTFTPPLHPRCKDIVSILCTDNESSSPVGLSTHIDMFRGVQVWKNLCVTLSSV